MPSSSSSRRSSFGCRKLGQRFSLKNAIVKSEKILLYLKKEENNCVTKKNEMKRKSNLKLEFLAYDIKMDLLKRLREISIGNS